MEKPAQFQMQAATDRPTAILGGDWTTNLLGGVGDALTQELRGRQDVTLDLTKVRRMDTAGAYAIIRAVGPGIVFSARSDSHTVGVAAGVDGGRDGRRARLIRNFGTPQQEELFSKTANIALEAGESVRIETPGGGGYGAASARPRARVAQDLADGKISADAARADYGLSA